MTGFPFGPDHGPLPEMFAAGIAVAIVNRVPGRLLARLRQILQRFRLVGPGGPHSRDNGQPDLQVHSALLAGVSAGMASSDDLEATLRHAVRATCEALGYYSVNLFLVRDGQREVTSDTVLEVAASAGATEGLDISEQYVQAAHLGLVGRAARRDEVVLCNNVAHEPAYHFRPGTEAVASELCIPLRLSSSVIGVLNVESDRTNAFGEQDVRTLAILADQLGAAIARARLHSEQLARSTEIERLKAFNESIVQGIREGIILTDLEGEITFANRQFETMLSYPAESLLGRRWHGLVPHAWRRDLPSDWSRPGRHESRLCTRDGRELAVQVSVEPRWDAGVLEGSLLLFTDITERVRAEQVARALSEAGLALQAAETQDAVFAALKRDSDRTGLRVIVSLLDDDENLTIRFASLARRGLKVVERTLRFEAAGLQIPLALAGPLALVVRDRRPIFAPDGAESIRTLLPTASRGLAAGAARRLGLGPSIHVPMLVGAKPVGVISVSHPALSEADSSPATVFANQVATALDRARLYSETEERQQQVAVLAEAAQHLAATADVERLATGITEQVRRVFAADAAGLYIYDEGRGQLEMAAAPGYTSDERLVAERTAWSRHPGWVIRHRQALLAGDTNQDPRVVYIGSRPRFGSVMFAPLLIEGDRCIGSLAVSSRRLYAYKPSDLRLLSTLADQVAVAVANALRVREASAKAAQLERVSLAGQHIASHLHVPDLIQRSVAEAAFAFDVTHATVFLLDQQHRVTLAAHHPRGEVLYDVGADDMSWIRMYDRPLAISDLRDTEALRGVKMQLIERGIHSVLVVPLMLSQRVIGGMLLYAFDGKRGFGRTAQELARITAGQIAVAIENARLYQSAVDARKRTEAVIQSSFTAMLTVDSVGRVKEANPAAAALLGEPSEAIGNRLLDDVLGGDFWLDPDGPIAAARRTRAIVTPTERVLPRAGSRREREVLLGVAPMPDGYLISMADITRLKELDRIKTELVANVSHELRSPLASIKAYTELLLDGLVADTETYDRFLAVIDAQADRLGQCISNLLDLARVEADGYRVRPQPFSLREFVAEATEVVAMRAASKDIRIVVNTPEHDTIVSGDRDLLFSSLKNVIDNAVKYAHSGSTVDVRSLVGDDGGLAISVADEGPGIAPEDLSRIFDKFYRVRSGDQPSTEGSGLGLVIARQAAIAHGGDIRVESTVGQGSTFTLHLPREIVEPAAPAAKTPGASAHAMHGEPF